MPTTTQREPTFAELLAIALRSEPTPKGQWLPTEHPPGSPEKVEVLRERFGLHQPLFHPGDATGAPRARQKHIGRGSPEALARVQHVREGLAMGKTYRRMSAELGIWLSQVQTLVNLVRREKLTA